MSFISAVRSWLQRRYGDPRRGMTMHTRDPKTGTYVFTGGICAGCAKPVGANEPAVGDPDGIFHWDCAPERAKAKARAWE